MRARNVVVDLTDLVERFARASTVTGIQRVVIELGGAMIAAGAVPAKFDTRNGEWIGLPSGPIQSLLTLSSSSAAATDLAWTSAVQALRDESLRSEAIAFAPGTILVTLGAPWDRSNLLQSVRVHRRQSGLRYAVFVHDTVPIDFPEYCEGDTAERFRTWFYSCAWTADVLIVNSAATSSAVRRACEEVDLVCPPIIICRLDGVPANPSHDPPWPSAGIRRLLTKRYALFVATLEPRKNHLGVITAWRKLIAVLGEDTPLMVFAGVRGWAADAIASALKDPRLFGKVVVVLDATCNDLEALYRNCMFTVYNSFWEGWGLPVSESIAHGKVPVVPAHSGLLESGSACAEFFTQEDGHRLEDVVARLVGDERYLAARTRDAAATRMRSWTEIAAGMVTSLKRLLARNSAPAPARIEDGTLYRFSIPSGHQPLAYYRDAAAAEALRGTGWHYQEDWGTWTAAPRFEIRGQIVGSDRRGSESAFDEDLAVYVAVLGHHAGCDLSVRTSGGAVLGTYEVEANQKVLLRMTWPSHCGSQLELMFEQNHLTDLGEKAEGVDDRIIGVGLISLMVSRGSDLEARCRFYESLLVREANVTLAS